MGINTHPPAFRISGISAPFDVEIFAPFSLVEPPIPNRYAPVRIRCEIPLRSDRPIAPTARSETGPSGLERGPPVDREGPVGRVCPYLSGYEISNFHVFRTHRSAVKYRSLSQTEARVILSLEAERQELVTLAGIEQRAGVTPGFARKLAHDLVRDGWLQRVRRGTYLLNPSRGGPEALPDTDPFRLGRRLVAPYYFAFATAAELHGFLPQASRTYYLVSTARSATYERPPARFRVVHCGPPLFFGTTSIDRRGERLVVSDPERTVLDCLNRPELSGGLGGVAQIFAQAKPRIDWRRFGSYLDRFGRRSLALRAGFLSERVRPSVRPPAAWVRARLARATDPYVPLGPSSTGGRAGPRDDRWHVIRNVSDAQLFAEGEIP